MPIAQVQFVVICLYHRLVRTTTMTGAIVSILPILRSAIHKGSNAAGVRNISRFNDGKLPGNSKHPFLKSQKIKQFLD